MASAHSHGPHGVPSSSSAAAPSAANTMLANEIPFGETPALASQALKRWTRALPRAAIGRRLPAADAGGALSIVFPVPHASRLDNRDHRTGSSGGRGGRRDVNTRSRAPARRNRRTPRWDRSAPGASHGARLRPPPW